LGSRLGQHFLTRDSVLQRIARAACPSREPLVVEIGPGKGALTRHLLEHAERVVAIEVDPYLVHYLRQKFRDMPRLEIVEQDVLKADLTAWGAASIAGNLPYYITSPILERVFQSGGAWQRAAFLVQKEVAERLSAAPGSRDYGYLTVMAQLFAEVECLFAVPPAAFQPPPKVESAVVRLVRRSRPLVDDPAAFLRFTGLCFRHKRKTLRNNLRAAFQPARIDQVVEAGLRAEQIPLGRLIEIERELTCV
jgi:16S rRNA (adenine1518-N6/adenine1519-N6)-dimethyltransferase